MIALFTPFLRFCNRLVIGTLVVILVIPFSLIAYFNDTETAQNQGFVASELRWQEVTDSASTVAMGPGLKTTHEFTLPTTFTDNSTAANYDITATTSGDAAFCAALSLSANGYLGSVSAQASYFQTPLLDSGDSWQFELSYDPLQTNFAHGAKCEVTIVVEGWQETMSKATAGYRDRYTMTIPAVAHLVVLNEVFARPDVGGIEFIELFNNSDAPIDVAGWNITERTTSGSTTNHYVKSVPTASADLIAYDGSGSTIIPAQGWLALKYNTGTSYLNNDGDTVTLRDATDALVDEYAYVAATVGKSDARIPDGIGAWVDPIPTPNEPNLLSSEALVELSLQLLGADLAEVVVGTTTETTDNSTSAEPEKLDDNSIVDPIFPEVEADDATATGTTEMTKEHDEETPAMEAIVEEGEDGVEETTEILPATPPEEDSVEVEVEEEDDVVTDEPEAETEEDTTDVISTET